MIIYTPDQIEKRKLAQDFAKKALSPEQIKKIKSTEDLKALWKRCADFGLMALPIPKKYDGLEEDLIDILAVMEGIGYGSEEVGIMFSLNAHIWACEIPILKFGTEAQKTKYLPELIRGEKIGAHCMTEQDAGSDVWNLKTTYKKIEGGFVLNGSKTFITNAPIADMFLVYAREEESRGMKGVSCFIVERSTDGFVVGNTIEKMGLEYSPFSSIYLNDCSVPEEGLLGKQNQASQIFNFTMDHERTFLFSFHIGLMERQLERCVQYAKERKQFDQKIIQFQSISHKLADMKVRYEAARLLCYKVAVEKMQNKDTFLSSSIAKLFISESLVKNSLDAIDIFGGYGYIKEYGIEHYLRDSIAGKIYSGTSDIQRNIISALLSNDYLR